MTRIEKHYKDLMGCSLPIKSKMEGMNWQTTVYLPHHTASAIASTEEESKQLAISKAELMLLSDTVVQEAVDVIAKSTTRMAMLEKVYLENKTQYHTDNKHSIATKALSKALEVNSSEGKIIIKDYKKYIKNENKQSAKYLKKADNCIAERISKSPKAVGKEHIMELSGELFQNFCDAFYSADRKGYRHLMAAILAVDEENGKIEIDGRRYALVL